MKERYKLVFVVSEHDTLGILFEAWVVSLIQANQFSLTFRKVNKLTIKDYDLKLTTQELELLDIISEYSDESITKRFSKEKGKAADFLRVANPKLLAEHIRPFIERRMARCFDLMLSHKIALHFKGKRKDSIQDEPLQIKEHGAEAIFHFEREENGIRYFITARAGNEELSLFNKGARILVLKPCIFILNKCIYRFNGNIDGNKLIPFFSKEFIQIPKSSEKKYFSSFVQTAVNQYEVEAKGFEILQPELICEPLLSLEHDLSARAVLKLKFRYGSSEFLWGDPSEGFTAMEEEGNKIRFLKIRRKISREKQAAKVLENSSLENKSGAFFSLKTDLINPDIESTVSLSGTSRITDQEILNSDLKRRLVIWLGEHKVMLEAEGLKIVQDFFNEKYFTGSIRLDMSLQETNDWFDVQGDVYFNNIKVPFIRLRYNILNNIREFSLPDGSIAILPEVWFSRYRDLAKLGNVSGNSFTFRRHHFALAKDMARHANSSGLVDYESLIRNRNIEKIHIPDGLNAKLRPYQAEGYQWMSILQELNLGGCLADDMGLGKTLQTLVILMQSKRNSSNASIPELSQEPIRQLDLFSPSFKAVSGQKRTSLIVMPLSLIHNWINEIIKFTTGLRTFIHAGQDRVQDARVFLNYDIILTTYGIVRNDLDIFRQVEFWYIILDESQLIKNPQSKLFRSVKQLRSQHKLVLTGTPIENSLVDLWAQLSFLNDGLLGNLNYFKEEYAVPIEKNKDPHKEEKLQRIIGPFILRRTKEMVARDLPSLSEQIYYCEMSEEQRSLYEEKKSEIRNMILENITRMGTDRSRFVILKGLMQLRLLSNHPALFIGNISIDSQKENIPSGKFEEVLRNLENLRAEGHKVLIYSQFVKHLRLFREYFEKQSYPYSMLTGQTINEERQKVIRDFQEQPDKHFFLITLKAGGVGLNLTAADYVFLLDPWWNPAVESQAISRAHRIGQEKKVFSYKFITRDSIEEKILQLQSRKSELASLFINNNNPLRFFTKETIIKLIE